MFRLITVVTSSLLSISLFAGGQTTRPGVRVSGSSGAGEVVVLRQLSVKTGSPGGTVDGRFLATMWPKFSKGEEPSIIIPAGTGRPVIVTSSDGASEEFAAAEVSPHVLQVLGIRPRTGRSFTVATSSQPSYLEAVVVEEVWQERLGLTSPALLGVVAHHTVGTKKWEVRVVGTISAEVLRQNPEIGNRTELLLATQELRHHSSFAAKGRLPSPVIRIQPHSSYDMVLDRVVRWWTEQGNVKGEFPPFRLESLRQPK